MNAAPFTHIRMTLLKPRFLFAFLSLGLLHTGHAQIKVQTGEKVAFLGDSITQFGWSRPGGYVHLVADALESAGVKIAVVPAGVSGNTSRNMLDRLEKSVLIQMPAWMTLSCGVNDVWHHDATHVDLEPYKANITAIVDKAQAAGVKVVILTATMIKEVDNPDNQALAPYNDFLRQLAKERNLPLADLNALCWKALKARTGDDNLLTVDGVHMNPDGNMVMAAGILEAFGMTADQIAAFEKKWRESPTAAAVSSQINIGAMAPVSLQSYHAIHALAKEQKIAPELLESNLLFEAIRVVMKAHEQDAAFTWTQAQGEIQKAFAQKIEEATKAPAK